MAVPEGLEMMARMHTMAEANCFGCGAPMEPEKGKNGGWCVRCPDCRRRTRRYEHQKTRRVAERQVRDYGAAGKYMVRWLDHDCEKLGC
jgi:tRNA(Ile2) C34 agmatinyltransferase TiaS